MPKVFAMLLLCAATVGGVLYYRNEASKARLDSSDAQDEAKPSATATGTDKDKTAGVMGPLAQWMDKSSPADEVEKPKPLRKPNPKDRIAPSPVGTSAAIVHKTFAVASAAKFAFEVPAHAAAPQMHGTFHSFAQAARVQSSAQSGGQTNDEGDVDLLLMNDQQYADFAGGRPSDVVYSIDASHDQDVSFGLPATLDRPAQYYLVFRNASSSAGKKVVQADFRVDF
jgi:hypothetical protein